MGYCGPRGIPYEHWLGVADGWTEYSRQAALAWQSRENQRCGDCGQVRPDWLGADGKELRRPPFDVVDEWCPGCDALHLHREDQPDYERDDPAIHQSFRPVT
jgi:hypothetical protein